MAQDDSEYRIIDDGPQIGEINGKGFKVVVKAVNTVVSNDTDVDPERDVTGFFKDREGNCLICELRCGKDDCTECDVPHFSERITSEVMSKITSHKAQVPPKMGGFRIQKGN